MSLRPELELAQFVTLIIAIVILSLNILWMFMNKHRWLYGIPLVMWMIHTVIFYAVLFIDRATPAISIISYTQWSVILRLHGFMTLLSIELGRPDGVLKWLIYIKHNISKKLLHIRSHR